MRGNSRPGPEASPRRSSARGGNPRPAWTLALGLVIGKAWGIDVPLALAPGGQPMVLATDSRAAPRRCVLDTGAMQSVLAPALIASSAARRLGEIEAVGAGGSVLLSSWQIEGWHLDGHPLAPFPALARDLGTETPCVLGLAVLGTTRIELDGAAGRLRAADDLPALPLVLPYVEAQGFIRLSLPFPGDTRATLILDSGAGTTVLNRTAGALLGLDPKQPAGWTTRRGLDGQSRLHRVHGLAGLMLLPGGAALNRVEVAEIPVLTPLGVVPEAPGGLLGADAWRGRRVLIDRAKRQLELEPASP